RALQDQEMRRASKNMTLRPGSRLIGSTRVELEPACRQGAFRRDLCLRLQVVTLRIPPLRERREDIPLLVRQVLAQISAQRERSCTISNQAMKILLMHEWPGNVTELEACIQRAAAMADGRELRPEDLPAYLHPPLRNSFPDPVQNVTEIIPLAEVEKKTILGALERLKGDKMATARRLGIGKTTLYRKLREYGIAGQWTTRPTDSVGTPASARFAGQRRRFLTRRRHDLPEYLARAVKKGEAGTAVRLHFHCNALLAGRILQNQGSGAGIVSSYPDSLAKLACVQAVIYRHSREAIVFIVHPRQLNRLSASVFVKCEAAPGIDHLAFCVLMAGKDQASIFAPFIVVKQHARLRTTERIFLS